MIILKRATPEAIRYACLNFHYAKSVPSAYYAYNVYNDRNEWCGVIIYGGGATPNFETVRNGARRGIGIGPGRIERETTMYKRMPVGIIAPNP